MKGLVPIYLFEAAGWAGAAWYWHSKKTHSELAKAIVIVLAVLVAIGEVIHITWQAGIFSTSTTPKRTTSYQQYAVPADNSGANDYSIYGTADRNQAGGSAVTQVAEIERQAVTLFDQKQYKKAKPLFEQACKGGVVEACNKLHDGLLTGEHATNPRLTERLPINGFTGKYSGMVRNITEGLSTTFTVSLRESKDGYIEGCMTVEPPLGGSGYLKGQVQDSKFSFDVVGALSQISFTGQREANNLSGTYLVSFPEGPEQNGSFSLHRVSLDFPNSGFSSTSCPDDSAILTPAAEQGNTAAQEYLAAMYYLGRGVPKDYSKARKLFTTACVGGDQKACDILRKKF
jgi:TPR repeat protein